MREHLRFLKTSSAVVKIAAWIFLLLGLSGSSAILSGIVSGYNKLAAIIILAVYTFFFFFLF